MASPKDDITNVIQQLVQPFLDQEQFELIDVEYVREGKNWFLRLYVDKEGGIDIEDCGRVSEFLSAKLDEADPIPTAYYLEVSSPGVERPLKKPADFEQSIGQNVLLTTYEQINGEKEFEGILSDYNADTVTLQMGKQRLEIPSSQVASARLAVTF